MTRPLRIILTAALSVSARSATAASGAPLDVPAAQATYATHCASCHGAARGGSPMAPALTGPEFAFAWKAKSVDDLTGFIKGNMPPGRAGSLTDRQYHDLASLLQDENH